MKNNTKPHCRGIRSDCASYSETHLERVKALIPAVRADFALDVYQKRATFEEKVLIGRSVESDVSVLLTMRSWYPEDSSLTDAQLKEQIYDALYDCATRDHWYSCEKEWE